MTATTATKLITPIGTLSYPWLEKPQAPQAGAQANAQPKYSATLIFPAGTDLTPLKNAITAAVESKWPGKSKDAKFMAGLHKPLRNDPDDITAKGYPEGSTFINVRTTQQPGLVYSHAAAGTTTPEIVPQDKIRDVFYPGAKVRASVTAYCFDVNGKKGPTFALNNMQKVAEGDRLDNRVAAQDEFVADMSAEPADLEALTR